MSSPPPPSFDQLASRIEQVRRQIERGAASSAPLLDALASPLLPGWDAVELWCLVAFVQHERRQQWVGYLVESRLGADSSRLGAFGAFAHPELDAANDDAEDDDEEQARQVPGEPDWRYDFHGCGCCLTHRDGTVLDVDFGPDGSTKKIDPYFYERFLESCPNLSLAERRLRRPEPFESAWQATLPELARRGMIELEHAFRLTDQGRAVGEWLEPLVDPWDSFGAWDRVLIACLCGDFELAEQETHSDDAKLRLAISHARQASCERRLASLRRRLADAGSKYHRVTLAALGALGFERASTEILAALAAWPVTGSNLAALDVLIAWSPPDLASLAATTLQRLLDAACPATRPASIAASTSSDSLRPQWSLMTRLMRLLLASHEPSSLSAERANLLRRALRLDYDAMEDDAAFCDYLLNGAPGLSRLSRALTSRVPITRQSAACMLALIGDELATQALIERAQGAPERGGLEAACALSLMPRESAQRAAERWRRRHDGYEDAGPGTPVEWDGKIIRTWSGDEVARANCREQLRSWFQSQTRRLAPLLERWRPAGGASR